MTILNDISGKLDFCDCISSRVNRHTLSGECLSKRALIILYDAISALACAFVLSFAWTAPAFAYIDPSIMTYTIQAVAGVAVALSTVLGVTARRTRKKFLRLLDIDENAHRKREAPIHRVDENGGIIENGNAIEVGNIIEVEKNTEDVVAKACENGSNDSSMHQLSDTASSVIAADAPSGSSSVDVGESTASTAASANSSGASAPSSSDKPKRKKPAIFEKIAAIFKRAYAPNWRTRIIYALLACGFTIFTIFVMAPYEVVGGSAGSLVFSLADVWWVVALPAALAIIALSLLLSALRGKLFLFFLVLISSIGFAAYVQAAALNIGMPAADGGTIVWADHMTMMVVSSAVWIAIIVVPLIASFFNAKRAQGIVGIACACLLIVQGVGAISLFVSPPDPSEVGGMDDLTHTNLVSRTETAMTEDGLYTVSPKSNVVVFVLDTYDTTLLNRVVRMNPELLDDFDGFTNFENCTGAMIPTRFAVPYFMTGSLPEVGEDTDTYLAERYARSSFINDVYDAGYSIGLYTDSMQISGLSKDEQDSITNKTINMHELSSSTMDFQGTLESLVQIGLYRDVPWPFKYLFWYYTDQINGKIVSYDLDAEPGDRVYTMNDMRFYGQLTSRGLAVSDEGSAGAFRFIHLLGAHYPFSYDEAVEDLGTDNSTQEKQAQGAMRIVSEYINQLKELGVYDETTIIVTADHGRWFLTTDPLVRTCTPIMLVKPAKSSELEKTAEAAGTANSEFDGVQTSKAPVSQHDYLPTVAEAMGIDPTSLGSGLSVFDVTDESRIRTYLTTDSEGLRGVGFREYAIDGDALVFANWYETGNYWELHE